jgi:hypothetical protein
LCYPEEDSKTVLSEVKNNLHIKWLFRKNIINSPHCTCGAIETPTHYLLNCPHYNIPRQRHIFALNLPIPLSVIKLYKSVSQV